MKPAFITTLSLLCACASTPSPVPVTGAHADVQALVGKWTGEYHGRESGRSGSIIFNLAPGSDTARGDVVMVAREPGMSQTDAVNIALTRQAASQVLTIRFVRVSGNSVSGSIDPYPSPDCSCQLVTVFSGELKGDRMEGTFRTLQGGDPTPTQQGTWWASRSR